MAKLLFRITVGLGLLSACLVAKSGNCQAYPEPIASWDESTKDRQHEAARKLIERLKESLAAGEKRFVVAAGDYRFGRKDAENFALSNVSGLNIEAAGATFWFEPWRRENPILIRDCRNLRLTGLSIDYDPLPFYQGEVIAINRKEKVLDLRCDAGFAMPPDADWSKPGLSTKAMFFGADGRMRGPVTNWIGSVERRGNAVFRVRLRVDRTFNEPGQFELGDRLPLGDRRSEHVVRIQNGEAVTLEDVTVYASGFFALVEEGGRGGNVYRRCKIIRRPGTGRVLASNADVFHSILAEKGPTIEDCEFSYAGDDLINIHGYFSQVLRQESPTRLIVVQAPAQSFWQGSEIRFHDFDTMATIGTARVKQLTRLSDAGTVGAALRMPDELSKRGDKIHEWHRSQVSPFRVELDCAVTVKPYDLVGCEDRMAAGTVIRRNHLHDNVTRGMLLKCKDAVVADNRIERTGRAGIALAADRGWMEGPFPHHIQVTGNALVGCGVKLTSDMPRWMLLGAISVTDWSWASGGERNDQAMPNHHLSIVNNRIVQPAVCGILITNVRDCRVENNTIEQPCTRPPRQPAADEPRYGVFVTAAENVVVRNNSANHPTPHCRGAIGFGAGAKPAAQQRP